ncbi:unnamed protein product, partial [Choristocarpus tenellus]
SSTLFPLPHPLKLQRSCLDVGVPHSTPSRPPASQTGKGQRRPFYWAYQALNTPSGTGTRDLPAGSMSNACYESDDEDICPLCCEVLDLSDKNFMPCPCGYRVCMWCWHRIKENYSNLCPACRSTYSDDPHAFAAVDKDAVIKNENKKKQRAKQKESVTASAAAAATAAREHQHALHLRHYHQHQQHLQHLQREQQQQANRGGGNVGGIANRRDLATMRVVQRNIVCVNNLPTTLGSEEALRKPEYFGQYGRIYKITVSTAQGSVTANITFAHKKDALACILAADGFWLEGRQLRANFGTNKFCATFLRNSPCTNPDCLFLHELGEEEDRFTKEEVLQRSILAPPLRPGVPTVTGEGGPSGTGKRCSGSPVLPPPVYEAPERVGTALGGIGMSAATQAGGQGVATSAQAGAGRVVRAGVGQKVSVQHQRREERDRPQAQVQQQGHRQRELDTHQVPSTAAVTPTMASRATLNSGNPWGGGRVSGTLPSPRLGGAVTRRKVGVAMPGPSPSASPRLPTHTSQRLAEEWPSLADTAATPAPAPAPAPAAQPAGRRNRRKKAGGTPVAAASIAPPAPVVPITSQAQLVTTTEEKDKQEQAQVQVPVSQTTTVPSQPPGLGFAPEGGGGAVLGGEPLGQGKSLAGDGGDASKSTPSSLGMPSMFLNPFFGNGVSTSESAAPLSLAGGAGAVSAAPAPPGFSSFLPQGSGLTSTVPVPVSAGVVPVSLTSPNISTNAMGTSSSSSLATPGVEIPRSLFGEHFNGDSVGDSVFSGGMFSSSAIGGGMFAGAEVRSSAVAPGSVPPSPAMSMVMPASPATSQVPMPPSVSVYSPAQVLTTLGSPPRAAPGLGMPSPFADSPFANGLGNGQGGSGSVTAPYGLPGGTTMGTVTPPAPGLAAPSPFGSTFGGGHFSGAFGSALFPVSSHQGARSNSDGGESGE